MSQKLSKPFDLVVSGKDQRFVETAKEFSSNPEESAALNGWARGADEGKPAKDVEGKISELMLKPDKRPGGKSPISDKPGQSFNEFKKPLLHEVASINEALGPKERALVVTSGGGLQVVDAWAKAGKPADFEFDHKEMAGKPYWSATGKLFRLANKGLREVPDNSNPGLYFTEHGATKFNPPKSASPSQHGDSSEAEAKPHEYSSTQLNMPETIADTIRKFGSKIPDDKLAEDGREDEPHVTLKYGLHDQDPAGVQKILEGNGPVTVKFGTLSLFPANEGQEARGGSQFDVLKLDIDSPQLRALNKRVSDALPHTDTFKEYHPHVTVAYLKPGEGKKYVGRPLPNVTGKTITIDAVRFSPKDGPKTDIALTSPKGRVTVTAPDGSIHQFPNPRSAASFRQAIGGRS